MSRVFVTSDLHLGHKLAAKMRGFGSVDMHDGAIIDRLERDVGKRDTLWILGDVAMNRDSLNLLKTLPFRKNLVYGNHDTYSKEIYAEVFNRTHGFLKYKNVWLSHCPVHPQEMFRCNANVHGHIHKNAGTKNIGFPYINVNWDFWFRPVNFDEIREMVIKGKEEQERDK